MIVHVYRSTKVQNMTEQHATSRYEAHFTMTYYRLSANLNASIHFCLEISDAATSYMTSMHASGS